MALFRRNKRELHTIELYDAGKILYRTDEFWRQTQMFILPAQSEGQNGSIAERISACFPKIISMNTLTSDDGRLYFATDDWQAQLALIHTDSDKSVYEFWFSDPRSSTDHQSFLQMNALSTAVEKAFLLTNINTLVVVRYASADERAFKIGMAAAGTQVLDVIKWAKVTPFSVAMQAVRTGSKSIAGLYDSDLVAQANKTMLSNKPVPLLSRFMGTPALPEKLKAAMTQEGQPENEAPNMAQEKQPKAENELLPAQEEQSQNEAPSMEYAPQPKAEDEPLTAKASQPKVKDKSRMAQVLHSKIRNRSRATLFCAHCGQENSIAHKFCNACGSPLKR